MYCGGLIWDSFWLVWTYFVIYIFFSDNSLLFGQANDASVTVLQEVIGDYEKALVQKVSSEKSSVFFSKHVGKTIKDAID